MDLSDYALDGRAPSSVERPSSTEEAATVLGAAHRGRRAVVLHGGATRVGIGDAPTRYDVALDLRDLSGIVEHSAADLVCIVRAGTTLAALAEALRPAGQRWPIDAPDQRRATVGGTIASAAPAASRLRHQHPRDWVIGCEAVLGDGTRVRAGGRVVKNVTGYDLSRLYSGTYGTLAALTELSLKLVAIDEDARVLRLRGEPTMLARVALAQRATLPLDGIVLATGPEPALYIRAAGRAAAVERLVRDARALGAFEVVDEVMWTKLGDRVTRDAFVARLAVPPGREPDFVGGDGLAYVGTGIGFVFGERAPAELVALRERCDAVGGALVLERATVEQKRAVGVWRTRQAVQGNHEAAQRTSSTPTTASTRIASELKRRFDPHDVLAPGRMPV